MTVSSRAGMILTIVNILLLCGVVAERWPAAAQGEPGVLRGRGLELIDARGQVRAEFTVEPDGEAVFRMRDGKGTIRFKLGAGANGSGLVLFDESTEPAVQILARRVASPGRSSTSIRLKGSSSEPRVITP